MFLGECAAAPCAASEFVMCLKVITGFSSDPTQGDAWSLALTNSKGENKHSSQTPLFCSAVLESACCSGWKRDSRAGIEVKYLGESKNKNGGKSLRHANFLQFRYDK